MTPEREAEIAALGSLKNEVKHDADSVFHFICDSKRGIRELMAGLQQQRQWAEVVEEARKNARADADKWALESATQLARAEAAETNARHWEQTAREYSRVQEHTKKRAEAAEAALTLVPEYADYYAATILRGGEPETFDDWRNGANLELNPYVTLS